MSSTAKFSAEEKAAMRARAKELKLAEEGDAAIKAAFKKMSPADRKIAERIHKVVTEAAPGLTAKTWYGMPAYADKDGKVVIYFRESAKFKERYGVLGFQDPAKLDKGTMWPVVYAITFELSAADEKEIAKLVKKAVA